MTNRLIDISDTPAFLSIRGELLVIHREDEKKGNISREDGPPHEVTVPLVEIAVLIVSHPRVTFTHAVLAGLARGGATFVACNEKHMPVAMLLPLEGHFTQGERFEKQAACPLPTRKRLWKEIVRMKIRAQGRLLFRLYKDDRGLLALADRVHSGDPDNIESQAARRYWPSLFADPDFRRERTREDQNRLLNYGYTVLRAIVSRAICAAGLHPSLGLHHHNRYDVYRLADDLMEPFRPIVDDTVVKLVNCTGPETPLDRTTKSDLIEAMTQRFSIGGESRTLFDIVARVASNLTDVFEGKQKTILLPDILTVS